MQSELSFDICVECKKRKENESLREHLVKKERLSKVLGWKVGGGGRGEESNTAWSPNVRDQKTIHETDFDCRAKK